LKEETLYKESTHTVICQILGFVFAIVTSIVLNRLLGVDGKGRFTALLIVPQLVVAFTHLGYGIASSYFIAKKKYAEGDVFRSDLLLNLVIGIIGFGIGFLIYNFLFPEESIFVRLGLLFLVFSGLWFYYFPDILLGKGKLLLQNYWNLAYQAIRFLFITGFLLFFVDKLLGAVSASIALGIALYVASFFVLSRVISFKGSYNASYIREGFRFGRKVFFTEVLGFLNYRFDIIFLKIYSTAAQIGLYSTAVFIAETLWMVPRAVSLALYTRLVRGEVSENATTKILTITVLLVVVLACISIFVVKPLIRIFYTDAFVPAYLPFLILLPGIVFLTVPKVLASHFVGVWGKPELLLKARGVAVPINIILNLILIPRYGMHGAAIASSVSYITESVIIMTMFRKRRALSES
jgi:O-antigen/teichoic acid export membrane protein